MKFASTNQKYYPDLGSHSSSVLTLVYKCLVSMAPFYLTSLFHVRISKYNLRGVKKFIVPKVGTTTFGLNTF